jgi:glycerate dehydrogenase
MNIVVTDGYLLNPGDLSWEPIRQFGHLTVYDRTAPSEVVERCRFADIALTNKTVFSAETLAQLPKLQFISVLATGYNVIDVQAARKQGITVSNVPGYGTATVAQHTFSLILELTNHVGLYASSVGNHEWERSADWSYNLKRVSELEGKILGIVGFGNIGQQVAKIAAAFGMEIRYSSRTKKDIAYAQFTDLQTLFSGSDIISLHCPLQTDNHQFVNKRLLNIMKSSALLINTARGQLIHEEDLAEALNQNRIAGAGLDVLSTEPPLANNPLLTAKNCIITPHIAWNSLESRTRVLHTTVKNISAFMQRSPVHVVN